MEPVRVALLGAGHLGTFHARALRRLAGEHRLWIHDPDAARARRLAQEVAAVACDLAEALAAADAVVIAAPTAAHAELALQAFDAGCDVFVEKPITRTLAEGEQLVQRAAADERILQVGHIERFNPIFRAVAADIGVPAYVEAERLAPFVPRSLDVDVVLDLMIHDLDLVLAQVPADVAALDAAGAAVLTPREDIASARLRFANGTVANLTASRVSQEKSRKIRFFSRHAYLSLDLAQRTARRVAIRSDAAGDVEVPGMGRFTVAEEQLEQKTPDPLEQELHAFLTAVQTRTPPPVSGAQALRVLRVADAIRDDVQRSLRRFDEAQPCPIPGS